ncbi:diaminohydroxyphosphoribosylaminopyrimidine deaminase [Devosia enhydra]|uniref:Riboflavin biosynthesis protein RibD n=1 Tax=Devosia enhydra TaxID=665118 RepID=A0A1K2HTK9_9HYPH|nr:bifunctional diaminohydroxyphosphoribosylaminopyrimidine deaminase/5-amino-6-(5-phosphoribosylamino)uracil reductase RibD [Devosia enhydra]SFZ81342.1 diaminohydroxyphosphoribosylaminopyrimidine deaminase [Devosia enhydra]
MTASVDQDLRWLDSAVRTATPWLGTTAENPTVGALVVDPVRQILLGRGVTARGGRPHAETQALAQAGAAAAGATLYVTLEPCNHWGRTPPCSDAVIRAGIARVVIGITDPDPRTAGAGVAKLRAAGIAVEVLDHGPSARLHEGHVSRKQRRRPFVTLKLAVSADGMIGKLGKANLPITGSLAQRWTHMQRALSDGVMVGARTARIDDPRLSVRLPGLEGRRPLRIVLAGAEPLPADLTLFAKDSAQPTLVIAQNPSTLSLPDHVQVAALPSVGHERSLVSALEMLSSRGVARLLVEGGARLAEALLVEGLADRIHLLFSPVTVGEGGVAAPGGWALVDRIAAAGFAEVDRRALGDDMLRTFEKGA